MLTRSFKHTVDVTGEHNPFLAMSAPSPVKGRAICVRLTPGSWSVSIGPALQSHGGHRKAGSTCALGLCCDEHSERLAEVKLQGRRVDRDLRAYMCCVRECFLNISNLLTPAPGPNQNKPRDWGTQRAAQKLVSVAIQFKWRPEEREPSPVLARQQLWGPGIALAESGDLHCHALGSALSPGLLIILQALSSL